MMYTYERSIRDGELKKKKVVGRGVSHGRGDKGEPKPNRRYRATQNATRGLLRGTTKNLDDRWYDDTT